MIDVHRSLKSQQSRLRLAEYDLLAVNTSGTRTSHYDRAFAPLTFTPLLELIHITARMGEGLQPPSKRFLDCKADLFQSASPNMNTKSQSQEDLRMALGSQQPAYDTHRLVAGTIAGKICRNRLENGKRLLSKIREPFGYTRCIWGFIDVSIRPEIGSILFQRQPRVIPPRTGRQAGFFSA